MAERILANTYVSDESFWGGEACWVWMGAVCRSGSLWYGKLSVRWKKGPRKGKLRTMLAHKVAAAHLGGYTKAMQRKVVVAHRCNNSLCCNPRHLMTATQRKNIQQCVAEGRHVPGTRNQYTKGKS